MLDILFPILLLMLNSLVFILLGDHPLLRNPLKNSSKIVAVVAIAVILIVFVDPKKYIISAAASAVIVVALFFMRLVAQFVFTNGMSEEGNSKKFLAIFKSYLVPGFVAFFTVAQLLFFFAFKFGQS